jgi:hypothetical protein
MFTPLSVCLFVCLTAGLSVGNTDPSCRKPWLLQPLKPWATCRSSSSNFHSITPPILGSQYFASLQMRLALVLFGYT